MTNVICHGRAADVPAVRDPADIHVLMFETANPPTGVATIGSQVKKAVTKLGIQIDHRAFDFLTIAMAVTAADTFVSRMGMQDRWARVFDVSVPLLDPTPWVQCQGVLEEALNFLSGDRWRFEFSAGGPAVPTAEEIRKRNKRNNLRKADCISLFSGGLDSYLGVLDLIGDGKRPLLVSHSYPKDGLYQRRMVKSLSTPLEWLWANAHPGTIVRTDNSMRTRSFNFIAYGAVAATALASSRNWESADFFIPENGQIALNPPLTPRRIGSLSTRTTHPFFLQRIQEIFDRVGLPVKMTNPHRHETKGDMLKRYAGDQHVSRQSSETVSCGKWKRSGIQCGCCVPCLIRRSAFHAAGISDLTTYKEADLPKVLAHSSLIVRDDLLAMLTALSRTDDRRLEGWVRQAGPLPADDVESELYVDVFRRGMREMSDFLKSQNVV